MSIPAEEDVRLRWVTTSSRYAASRAGNSQDEPGTFDFRCEVHPAQMTGTLVVE